MKEIVVQDDIDAHARLIGRALNYLSYLKDIREEAAAMGMVLMDGSWHDVPRDAFDSVSGELIEWQGFRQDAATYWSKMVRGFNLFTSEPQSARSRQPDVVKIAGGGIPGPLIVSDICATCGERRFRLSGDPTGGSPLVKTCEGCGEDRPL